MVSGYFSFLDHTYLDTASIAFSFGTDTCLVTLDNTYVTDGDRKRVQARVLRGGSENGVPHADNARIALRIGTLGLIEQAAARRARVGFCIASAQNFAVESQLIRQLIN